MRAILVSPTRVIHALFRARAGPVEARAPAVLVGARAPVRKSSSVNDETPGRGRLGRSRKIGSNKRVLEETPIVEVRRERDPIDMPQRRWWRRSVRNR